MSNQKNFKSTPKLDLVHLSSCFPLWLFLFPLFVSISVSQFRIYFLLFCFRFGMVQCFTFLSFILPLNKLWVNNSSLKLTYFSASQFLLCTSFCTTFLNCFPFTSLILFLHFNSNLYSPKLILFILFPALICNFWVLYYKLRLKEGLRFFFVALMMKMAFRLKQCTKVYA